MRKSILSGVAAAGLALSVLATAAPANAALLDSDRDGMPNSWEIKYKMNPFSSAGSASDLDRDGLTNAMEYKYRGNPRDEDTDNDGQDDRDEVSTRTYVAKSDTDGDGIVDGDEDYDRDRIANEDEDDALEYCAADDDDVDRDNVDDEDENELRLKVGVSDSDGDGVVDGEEDFNRDGASNEDEDDLLNDRCSGDLNRDGEDDEDQGDRFGTVKSFDFATGILVVTTVAGTELTIEVGSFTEFEYDDEREGSSDSDGADLTYSILVPGAVITELEINKYTGELEEISIG